MSNETPPYRYLSGSRGPDPARGQDYDDAEAAEREYAAPPRGPAPRPAWLERRRDFLERRPEQSTPRQGHGRPQGHPQGASAFQEPRPAYDAPQQPRQDRRTGTDRRQAPAGFGESATRSVDSRQAFAEAQRAHAERHGPPPPPRQPAAGPMQARQAAMAAHGATERPAAAPAADAYEDDPERMYESFSELYEDFEEGRSKTPFVIIGALLAVAIVGGGLALAYKTSGGSTGIDGPPVVRADDSAARVPPEEPGGLQIPHQDRQVYEQVAGQGEEQQVPATVEPSGGQEETAAAQDGGGDDLTIGALAERATDSDISPGGALPAASEESAIPRNLGQSLLPPTGQAAGGQGTGQNASVFEPRRVRTVEIGPDGAVVGAPAGEAAAPPPASAAPAAGQGAIANLLPSRNPAPLPVLTPSAPPPTVANGIATSEDENAGVDQPAGQTSALAPLPRSKPRPSDAGQSTLRPSTAPQPRPIQRTAAANPAPAAVDTGALAGFAVQVASNRSQADAVAKFADLQSRYPNLISGYRPLIQRADLGDRGVFYRLRIGPIASKAEANQLCSSLRDAGLAGCFVRGL